MKRRKESNADFLKEGEGIKYVIKCLNIQGLTNLKYTDVFEEIGKGVVMCLMETQKKVNNIRVAGHLKTIERNGGEKRGGIMALIEEKEDLRLDKKVNEIV